MKFFEDEYRKNHYKIWQFQAKMLKHEIQCISENTQPKVVKI